MLNPFKNWLGIEGLKLELLVPEEVEAANGFIDGRVVFHTKQQQTIEYLEIKVVEKYTRGKGENVKVNEYELGKIEKTESLVINAFEEVFLDFALPFTRLKSDMDEWADQNFLSQKIAQAAKNLHQVESVYKVIATAKVKGTALHPFQEKEIIVQ